MLHVVALRSTGEAEGMERAPLPSTVVSLVTAAVLLSVCLSAAGLGRGKVVCYLGLRAGWKRQTQGCSGIQGGWC